MAQQDIDLTYLTKLIMKEYSVGYEKAATMRDRAMQPVIFDIIGEDEEYYGGTAEANTINDRVIHGRNRLRKQLRERIEKL